MANIDYLPKYSLVNVDHLSFMQQFLRLFDEVFESEESLNEKAVAKLALLRTAVKEENDLYVTTQKSVHTQTQVEQDIIRDNNYMWLKQIVEVLAKATCTEQEQARKVKFVIDKYRINVNSRMTAETTDIRRFGEEFAAEDMKQALTDCHVMQFFTAMNAANEEVDRLRNLRWDEDAQRVKEALRKAREASDTLYDEMANWMNSLALVFGEPYLKFITLWNSRMQYYREVLKGNKGKTEGDANGEGGEPKPEGGQPTPGNPSTDTDGHGSGPATEVRPETATDVNPVK